MMYTEFTLVYPGAKGYRCILDHCGYRFDVTGPDAATVRAQAVAWSKSVVDDKDTRADIDALGAALGVDTTKGKKADALKALRSFDDTGNLTRPT